MTTNEIMILIITIIAGILLVLGIYFGYTFITSKTYTKKNSFNTENLIDEESLMNFMDKKRNIEYGELFTKPEKDKQEDKKINPFGVEFTEKTVETKDYIKEDEEKAKRKFFK